MATIRAALLSIEQFAATPPLPQVTSHDEAEEHSDEEEDEEEEEGSEDEGARVGFSPSVAAAGWARTESARAPCTARPLLPANQFLPCRLPTWPAAEGWTDEDDEEWTDEDGYTEEEEEEEEWSGDEEEGEGDPRLEGASQEPPAGWPAGGSQPAGGGAGAGAGARGGGSGSTAAVSEEAMTAVAVMVAASVGALPLSATALLI